MTRNRHTKIFSGVTSWPALISTMALRMLLNSSSDGDVDVWAMPVFPAAQLLHVWFSFYRRYF
jgi:hypothetical protein